MAAELLMYELMVDAFSGSLQWYVVVGSGSRLMDANR